MRTSRTPTNEVDTSTWRRKWEHSVILDNAVDEVANMRNVYSRSGRPVRLRNSDVKLAATAWTGASPAEYELQRFEDNLDSNPMIARRNNALVAGRAARCSLDASSFSGTIFGTSSTSVHTTSPHHCLVTSKSRRHSACVTYEVQLPPAAMIDPTNETSFRPEAVAAVYRLDNDPSEDAAPSCHSCLVTPRAASYTEAFASRSSAGHKAVKFMNHGAGPAAVTCSSGPSPRGTSSVTAAAALSPGQSVGLDSPMHTASCDAEDLIGSHAEEAVPAAAPAAAPVPRSKLAAKLMAMFKREPKAKPSEAASKAVSPAAGAGAGADTWAAPAPRPTPPPAGSPRTIVSASCASRRASLEAPPSAGAASGGNRMSLDVARSAASCSPSAPASPPHGLGKACADHLGCSPLSNVGQQYQQQHGPAHRINSPCSPSSPTPSLSQAASAAAAAARLFIHQHNASSALQATPHAGNPTMHVSLAGVPTGPGLYSNGPVSAGAMPSPLSVTPHSPSHSPLPHAAAPAAAFIRRPDGLQALDLPSPAATSSPSSAQAPTPSASASPPGAHGTPPLTPSQAAAAATSSPAAAHHSGSPHSHSHTRPRYLDHLLSQQPQPPRSPNSAARRSPSRALQPATVAGRSSSARRISIDNSALPLPSGLLPPGQSCCGGSPGPCSFESSCTGPPSGPTSVILSPHPPSSSGAGAAGSATPLADRLLQQVQRMDVGAAARPGSSMGRLASIRQAKRQWPAMPSPGVCSPGSGPSSWAGQASSPPHSMHQGSSSVSGAGPGGSGGYAAGPTSDVSLQLQPHCLGKRHMQE